MTIGTLWTLVAFPGCDPDGVPAGLEPRPAEPTRIEHVAEPLRIVSLSPMASFMLAELGATDRIIGVDAASRDVPGLEGRPAIQADLGHATTSIRRLRANLVLVPADRAGLGRSLDAAGIETRLIDVHDFEDGFVLMHDLATRIGLGPETKARIRALSRPLAEISSESLGWTRPRVAAVAAIDPIVLVGGHAFESALIEIAGGENVTHGRVEPKIASGLEALRSPGLSLFVHVTAAPIAAAERAAFERTLSDIAPVAFVTFDRDRFFGPEAISAARALRDRIRERSSPLLAPAR